MLLALKLQLLEKSKIFLCYTFVDFPLLKYRKKSSQYWKMATFFVYSNTLSVDGMTDGNSGIQMKFLEKELMLQFGKGRSRAIRIRREYVSMKFET
jgi:hypothetical protein